MLNYGLHFWFGDIPLKKTETNIPFDGQFNWYFNVSHDNLWFHSLHSFPPEYFLVSAATL